MMKMRTRRALVLAGSVAAASLALSGCSAINSILGGGSGDATRDEKTGQVTESANIDVFSVKLGDCMLETGSGMLTDANVVPCTEPHDEEVFHEITMDDGEYSEDAISAASEGCIGDAFTSFVGVAYDQSALDVTTLTPSQDSWEQANDRVIQCLIVDPAGQVEGSLAGAAR
ncbi:septum formation family protein [Microbacterium paraoxydans]|uniref:Septum formation family protein n=2 Tax=Microbacterium paraoxydans TaxID=199592 RepID=A0ABS5IQT1_9MICO|nr:septum formation family protein [Microbacterium paraoxydans]MBS0024722.1 septum formation family protein [Microbacterium paraoxydans]